MAPQQHDQKSKTSASSGQNLPLGFAAAVGAMIVGTVLWILIVQKFQATWMSFVVAFGIGSALKYIGKAKEMWVGVVSAFLTLIAALAGNLATAIFIVVTKKGGTPGAVLAGLDFGTAVIYLKALAGPMGIIFYAVAIYIGFWFSFTHVPKTLPMDDD